MSDRKFQCSLNSAIPNQAKPGSARAIDSLSHGPDAGIICRNLDDG